MWDEAHRVGSVTLYRVGGGGGAVNMYRSQDMWDEAHRVRSVTLYKGGRG